jgi:hypothetical protein
VSVCCGCGVNCTSIRMCVCVVYDAWPLMGTGQGGGGGVVH